MSTRSQAKARDLPIPLPANLEVSQGRPLRLLPESVQDVDSLGELRHVKDPELHDTMDSQLVDAGPHVGHRFPVAWLEPQLDPVEL